MGGSQKARILEKRRKIENLLNGQINLVKCSICLTLSTHLMNCQALRGYRNIVKSQLTRINKNGIITLIRVKRNYDLLTL